MAQSVVKDRGRDNTAPEVAKSIQERLERFMEATRQTPPGNFMSHWSANIIGVKDVQVFSPTKFKATMSFKVDPFYCNLSGNLHGGAQASIYDVATSIAVCAIEENDIWRNGGVTRNLSVIYLRPAPAGEIVDCEVEVVHAAKRLALLKGTLRRQSDGEIVSTCDHDKASTAAKNNWML